jgi:hypothetical protein
VVLHTFASPVANVAGVAYDRRKRDDETTHHVVYLSAAGDVLGGFDTPGTKPAGLSYDPGP